RMAGRKTNKPPNMLECLKCKQPKRADNNSNYYVNTNALFNLEKYPVCKECISQFLGEKGSIVYKERVKFILAQMDKPFLSDLWTTSEETWEKYIPQISSFKQYKGLTFKDSTENTTKVIKDVVKVTDPSCEEEEMNLTIDLIKYWGRGYTNEDYQYLEEEKVKLMSSFECPDYGMEMIMRDICFLNLEIEKVRQEQKANGSKEISNLIKTRSDLMNDAKMKPIQATGAEANDQISFGVLIKKWENDRPIPQGLDDEMKDYIDTFMIGHLAKMEGLNNELTEKYDQALSEYTINFDELNRDDEDYGDD
ncbi:hypothetical protein, partial [Paenibacillus elgii]|uniref:hypothetical protein n=1 Tax=Paenibacillus elgii TaxID=189691 RepID=UPI002040B8C8